MRSTDPSNLNPRRNPFLRMTTQLAEWANQGRRWLAHQIWTPDLDQEVREKEEAQKQEIKSLLTFSSRSPSLNSLQNMMEEIRAQQKELKDQAVQTLETGMKLTLGTSQKEPTEPKPLPRPRPTSLPLSHQTRTLILNGDYARWSAPLHSDRPTPHQPVSRTNSPIPELSSSQELELEAQGHQELELEAQEPGPRRESPPQNRERLQVPRLQPRLERRSRPRAKSP